MQTIFVAPAHAGSKQKQFFDGIFLKDALKLPLIHYIENGRMQVSAEPAFFLL